MLIYASAAILNDIADAPFDRRRNPLTSGLLSASDAKKAAILSAVLGITLLSFYGVTFLLLGILLSSLGWLYSNGPRLKDTPLNVAFLSTTHFFVPFSIGYLTLSSHVTTEAVAFAFSVFVWLSGMIVLKDFKDAKRDYLAGRKNPVILLGVDNAAKVVFVSSILMVITNLFMIEMMGISLLPAIAVLFSSAAALSIGIAILRNPTMTMGQYLLPKLRLSVFMNSVIWAIVVI